MFILFTVFFFYATGLMRYNNLFSFSLSVKGIGKNATITLNWQLRLNYEVEMILETNICRRTIKLFLEWMYLFWSITRNSYRLKIMLQAYFHLLIWKYHTDDHVLGFKATSNPFIKDTLRQILLMYYLW